MSNTKEKEMENSGEIVSWKYAKALAKDLAKRQIGNKRLAIREAIANALDAEVGLGVEEVVEIRLEKERIEIEDWGTGITQEKLEKMQTIGNDKKEERIGYFGIGRLSLLTLGKTATYYSNNGEFGVSFEIREREDLEITKPTIKAVDYFLSHRGSKIVISDLTKDISEREIREIVKDKFSLRILKRGTKIIFQGKTIAPSFKFEPLQETFKHKFSFFDENSKTTRRGNVNGGFRESEEESGNIEVYVHDILIGSFGLALERKATGWVNCDQLQLQINRNDLVKDEFVWKAFLNIIQKELAKFPKKEITSNITQSELAQKMMSKFSNLLQEKGLMELFTMPKRQNEGQGRVPKLIEAENGTMFIGKGGSSPQEHEKIGSKTPMKESPETEQGVMQTPETIGLQEMSLEADKPAFFFSSLLEGGKLVINTNHPKTKKKWVEGTIKEKADFLATALARTYVNQLDQEIRSLPDIEKFSKEDEFFMLLTK